MGAARRRFPFGWRVRVQLGAAPPRHIPFCMLIERTQPGQCKLGEPSNTLCQQLLETDEQRGPRVEAAK